jgi:hypothetical protein
MKRVIGPWKRRKIASKSATCIIVASAASEAADAGSAGTLVVKVAIVFFSFI